MRKIQAIGLIFVFLIIVFIQFQCGKEDPPYTYGDCKYKDKISSYQPNKRTENITKGAIYLDLSKSMQGYISAPTTDIPFTLLQHVLHSVLQTTFHHVSISRPDFKGFSRGIENTEVPMKYYAISFKISRNENIQPRSRFNRGETNIVGVLSEISKKKSTLSVVITDGLQDVCSINGTLAPGFDRPQFIQAAQRELIENGFGVWLIGIMNEFDGYYYNIIPDRNGEINKPIYIKGKRPVYCWVVCRDINKGRKFVQYFYDTLSRLGETGYNGDGGCNKGSLVQGIELAPGNFPQFTLMEPRPYKHFQISDEVSKRITQIRDWGENKEQIAIKMATADFPISGEDESIFLLQGRFEFSNKNSWDGFPAEMWRIEPEPQGKFPLTIKYQIPGADHKESDPSFCFVFIKFPCSRLLVLQPKERIFEIPVHIYADLETGLKNHWLKKWSTAIDTHERYIKEKTLYLYDVVSEVLRYSIGKKRVGACLHLALIKRD